MLAGPTGPARSSGRCPRPGIASPRRDAGRGTAPAADQPSRPASGMFATHLILSRERNPNTTVPWPHSAGTPAFRDSYLLSLRGLSFIWTARRASPEATRPIPAPATGGPVPQCGSFRTRTKLTASNLGSKPTARHSRRNNSTRIHRCHGLRSQRFDHRPPARRRRTRCPQRRLRKSRHHRSSAARTSLARPRRSRTAPHRPPAALGLQRPTTRRCAAVPHRPRPRPAQRQLGLRTGPQQVRRTWAARSDSAPPPANCGSWTRRRNSRKRRHSARKSLQLIGEFRQSHDRGEVPPIRTAQRPLHRRRHLLIAQRLRSPWPPLSGTTACSTPPAWSRSR